MRRYIRAYLKWGNFAGVEIETMLLCWVLTDLYAGPIEALINRNNPLLKLLDTPPGA